MSSVTLALCPNKRTTVNYSEVDPGRSQGIVRFGVEHRVSYMQTTFYSISVIQNALPASKLRAKCMIKCDKFDMYCK